MTSDLSFKLGYVQYRKLAVAAFAGEKSFEGNSIVHFHAVHLFRQIAVSYGVHFDFNGDFFTVFRLCRLVTQNQVQRCDAARCYPCLLYTLTLPTNREV